MVLLLEVECNVQMECYIEVKVLGRNIWRLFYDSLRQSFWQCATSAWKRKSRNRTKSPKRYWIGWSKNFGSYHRSLKNWPICRINLKNICIIFPRTKWTIFDSSILFIIENGKLFGKKTSNLIKFDHTVRSSKFREFFIIVIFF